MSKENEKQHQEERAHIGTYRKPYQPKMEKRWWLKLPYYFFYIIRESTAFFMIWVSMVLMFGVICAHTNELGQDEFFRFIFFLRSPFAIVMNILALLAALLHTITWFNLVPKAVSVVILGQKPPAILLISSMWIMTLLASAGVLWFVFA